MPMNNSDPIKIENPWLLFVALGLIIVIIVGFFLLPKQKRTRPKNLISLGLHIVISMTLAMAFSNIQFLSTSSDVEVYVVADCSDSQKYAVKTIDNLVKDVYSKAQKNSTKVGLVAFAADGNQITVAKPGQFSADNVPSLASIFEREDFDRSTSNLASAMEYTSSLYTETALKRMIVISDGIETDGDAVKTVQKLNENNIQLDTIAVDDPLNDEFALTGVDYIDHGFVNRPSKVTLAIRSRKETKLKVSIMRDGEVVNGGGNGAEITVARGMNTYSYDITATEAATYNYTAKLSTIGGSSDSFKENNQISFTQDFTDVLNVLFVGESTSDGTYFNNLNLYATNTGIDQSKTTIDTYSYDHPDCPYELTDLIKYDEIVLSNVNFNDEGMTHAKEFATNLETAIRVHGKSLITLGATHSGDSKLDYVNNYNAMLPIQFDSDDPKALIFLIDVSGSMDTNDRITKAKNGAIACLDALNEKDYFGLVTFSDTTKLVQSLTSVKNKAAIVKNIKKLTTEGGTTMGPALKECGKQLANFEGDYKYIVTLSDGEPFDSESELKKIVLSLSNQGITTSFINIENTDSTAVALLKKLATVGGGMYKYVKSATALGAAMREMIVNEINLTKVEPEIGESFDIQYSFKNKNDAVLDNVGSLNDIYGLYYCRTKLAANTVLYINYTHVSDDDSGTSTIIPIPLYAYWNYGNGKVASFTSDIYGDWTSSFMNENGKKLLQNAAYNTLPERNADHILTLNYVNNGVTSSLKASPNNGDVKGIVKATATYLGTDGVKADEDPLKDQIGVAREPMYLAFDGAYYSGEIATGVQGAKYNIKLEYYTDNQWTNTDGVISIKDNEEPIDEVETPLYFDYSKEYDVFNNDANNVLYAMSKAANHGTYSQNEVNYSVSTDETSQSTYISTMMVFLLISVGLFLVDVFVRKSEIVFKKKVVDAGAISTPAK